MNSLQALADQNYFDLKNWDPGFDAERAFVQSKLGPYQKIFEKPGKFKKRFYHTVYPLAIEHWTLNETIELYDGFCTVDVELNIRFQATFTYLQKNYGQQDDINASIQTIFEPLIRDIFQNVLSRLTDGAWVQTGLNAQEEEIALAVNELLMAHEIQVMTLCQLKPFFKTFPDIKFKQESVYLMAMKKNYELMHQKQHEKFLQEQQLETAKLEEKQKRLDVIRRDNELELLLQSQQAEYEKKCLLESEAQQAEKLVIEQRMHAEKLKHETALFQLDLQEKLYRVEQEELLQRQMELKNLDEKIAHQVKLKEQELTIKIKSFELEKQQWSHAKAQWQIEDLKYKQRQKQLEIDAEIESKAYLYQQRIRLQEQIKHEK